MPKDTRKAISYDRLAGDNDYRYDPGVFALPVAELPPTDPVALANWSPVQMVQAYAPQMVRTARFYAKKKGGPPVIPKPADTGSFKILGGTISFEAPVANSNGGRFDWSVGGEYTFVQAVRVDPTDGFVLNGCPIELEIQRQNFQNYGLPSQPPALVASASTDVQVGYSQAQQINFEDPYWNYTTSTYYPGAMLDGNLLNGG